MKILSPILAVIVLAASCSSTEEVNSGAVRPEISANADQSPTPAGDRAGEGNGTPGEVFGSPAPAESDSGVRHVDPYRNGWQVIVPEEREYVREREFEWPGGSGQRVNVVSSEYAVEREYELESPDPRVRAPHFDGPFRVEILAELTAEGTVFGYFLWVRGVRAAQDADSDQAGAGSRLLTFRIFDYEGTGKFEPFRGGNLRVPNWVTKKRK